MMVQGGFDHGGSSEVGKKWSDSRHAMTRVKKKRKKRMWGLREVSS